MVDPDDLEALLADPYRVVCPRGHAALVPAATSDSAHCRTCGRSYPASALVDKRAGLSPGL